MQRFTAETFTSFDLRSRDFDPRDPPPPARQFENLSFHKCTFSNCVLSMTDLPDNRWTVRNVELVNCEEHHSDVGTAILEDVVVENFRTADLFIIWAAVFKHVVFKGRIGQIKINARRHPGSGKGDVTRNERFAAANAAYYRNVDWALDISQAEFAAFDATGIPARLFRRDPETQVVVTREKATLGEWKKLDLSKTYWEVVLNYLSRGSFDDMVLVAPKRDRTFRDLVNGLKLLREAGVAEPD